MKEGMKEWLFLTSKVLFLPPTDIFNANTYNNENSLTK